MPPGGRREKCPWEREDPGGMGQGKAGGEDLLLGLSRGGSRQSTAQRVSAAQSYAQSLWNTSPTVCRRLILSYLCKEKTERTFLILSFCFQR